MTKKSIGRTGPWGDEATLPVKFRLYINKASAIKGIARGEPLVELSKQFDKSSGHVLQISGSAVSLPGKRTVNVNPPASQEKPQERKLLSFPAREGITYKEMDGKDESYKQLLCV